MEFGIMFFSSVGSQGDRSLYHLVVEAARRADAGGLACIWVPERHFHPFGGLFPNPALLASALAMVTERLEIRAGSLVSPLHDTLRIAEEWAVADNLSGGRVAISFGSGWNRDDFVFFPERYDERHRVMYEQVEEVRALWRGEPVRRHHGDGRAVDVRVFPRPVRPELPVWITSSGNADTFRSAGAVGANLLTHLIGQTIEELAEKIAVYRRARADNGHDPEAGRVTLMLHTFLGDDLERVRAKVHEPFRRYLRSAVSLERMAAQAGGAISGGHRVAAHDIPEDTLEELLEITFERYFASASLLGTPESCRRVVWRAREAGVDEIACLVDFLDDDEAVLQGLGPLCRFAREHGDEAARRAATAVVSDFLEDLEVPGSGAP